MVLPNRLTEPRWSVAAIVCSVPPGTRPENLGFVRHQVSALGPLGLEYLDPLVGRGTGEHAFSH